MIAARAHPHRALEADRGFEVRRKSTRGIEFGDEE
jgi:hypothetical protein